MGVWAQFGDKRVTAVPPLSATDDPSSAQKADVFAYFSFSGQPLPEGAEVTFLVGKGKLPPGDAEKASDTKVIYEFKVSELRSALVPVPGITFDGGKFETTVGVQRQLTRDGSDNVVFSSVAKATLDPVTDLLDSEFTVIAYTTFDLLGNQERVQACSVDLTVSTGGGGTYLSVLERYDPIGDVWETKTSSENGRSGPVFEEVGGELYLIGGFNGNFTGVAEKYDPVTDSWTQKATMPAARAFAQTVSYGNEIYVIGGHDFNPGGAVATCHKYTPGTDTWTQLADLPIPVAFGVAKVLTESGSDYIYVMMGGSVFDRDDGTVTRINCAVLRYGPLNTSTDEWQVVDVEYGPVLASDGLTQESSTLQDAGVGGSFGIRIEAGLVMPPYGALTIDRGGPLQATLLYDSYTKNTGDVVLRQALPTSYPIGTTVDDATIPLIEARLGANARVESGSMFAVNGQIFLTYAGGEPTLLGSSVKLIPSTGVFDRTALTSSTLPRLKAGSVELSGSLYVFGGSGEKSDFLDESEDFNGSAWADNAEMLFGRHSLGAATDGTYIYVSGGAGSGHAPGWLKITAEASPEQVRADGRQTASIKVTAVDASGDPAPSGTKFRVSGVIYITKGQAEEIVTGGEDVEPEATETTEGASVESSTGSGDTELNPPAQKVTILPVLFTSNEITMGTDGVAATIALERSEDPINELENLAQFVKDGEAVPNQENLKKKSNKDSADKITTVGVTRDLYSAAIEITAVDDFYFGSTDSDKTIAGVSDSELATSSTGFDFNPPEAQAGLSAKITWYSDITSIPDVSTVDEELEADDAKAALDAISEEIPFGASPHYDALLTGARNRINPDVPRNNLMISTSDNQESFSQSTPEDVADEANSIAGQGNFPIFVTNFIVTDPVSLAARKSRTDVEALEIISDETGGSSFSVVDPSYVTFVIDRIKTAAPSSIGSGTVTAKHELPGPIATVFYSVDNLPADMSPPFTVGPSGNTVELRLFTSDDDYAYTELDQAFLPNVTTTLSEPLRAKYVKYEVRLSSKTFDSPILRSVLIGYVKPTVQYLFTLPQSITGQVSELAAVANHRLQLPTTFDHDGLRVEIGLYHGESVMFDRDYKNKSQPPITERGVVHAINRSFDTFVGPSGEISTADVLETDDLVVYTSKSGPWSQESTTRVFVNGQEALPASFVAFPERGLVVFQRKLGAKDVVTIEVAQPTAMRVGLKVTNDTLYEGLLDSFAYMYGTTESDPGLKANRPPRAINLFISPSPVLPGGPLVANYTFTDPDGDEEDTDKTEITWFRDGSPLPELRNKRRVTNNNLIARRADKAKFIEKGQEWFFTVRPSDGKAFGPLSVSHTIIVANQAPVAFDAVLRTSNKDAAAFTTSDTITAAFRFKDSDGDESKNTNFDWFVNGNLVKSGDANTLGPDDKDANNAKILKPGVTVRCEVAPSDGQEFGETATTDTITVTASKPVASDVKITPDKPFPTSRLKLTYKFTSPDSEQDRSTVAWFKNGSRITELDNLNEIPSSILAPRQQWYAVVTPVAADIAGVAVKSNVVVVQF